MPADRANSFSSLQRNIIHHLIPHVQATVFFTICAIIIIAVFLDHLIIRLGVGTIEHHTDIQVFPEPALITDRNRMVNLSSIRYADDPFTWVGVHRMTNHQAFNGIRSHTVRIHCLKPYMIMSDMNIFMLKCRDIRKFSIPFTIAFIIPTEQQACE